MTVVDSSGWIEYLTGTELGATFREYVTRPDLLVPTIVMYEVYKLMRRQRGAEPAELAVAELKQAQVVELDEALALLAAEVSLDHRLAMAAAVVYATAAYHQAELVTSDKHMAGLPGVVFLPK